MGMQRKQVLNTRKVQGVTTSYYINHYPNKRPTKYLSKQCLPRFGLNFAVLEVHGGLSKNLSQDPVTSLPREDTARVSKPYSNTGAYETKGFMIKFPHQFRFSCIGLMGQ